MKTFHALFATLLFGCAALLPAHAQDPSPEDAAAVAEAMNSASPTDSEQAPAEASPRDPVDPASGKAGDPPPDPAVAPESADTTTVDPAAAAPADTPAEGPVDTATTELPADSAPADAEAAPAEETPREPYKLYLGGAYHNVNVALSEGPLQQRLGGEQLAAKMAQLRGGIRVFNVVGIEAHFGVKADNGVDPGTIEMNNYFGVFIVPTGNIFELLEISTPVGFNSFQLIRGNNKETFSGISYGFNIELPMRKFGETLPDLRLSSGYKVHHADKEARVHGAQLGLRFDFQY